MFKPTPHATSDQRLITPQPVLHGHLGRDPSTFLEGLCTHSASSELSFRFTPENVSFESDAADILAIANLVRVFYS